LSILATITRIEQRPLLFGLFGAVFGLSSIVGPLLGMSDQSVQCSSVLIYLTGGAFTDHVSWRWCFYINLPFGGITVGTILLFIKPEHSIAPLDNPIPAWKRMLKLDWIGTVLCLGMVTSLLLPLQWGGVTKAWTDKSVIACFVVVRHPEFECTFPGILIPRPSSSPFLSYLSSAGNGTWVKTPTCP
jgi:MFS family permease